MITDSIKKFWRRIAESVARAIASTGITPNTLTLLGFALNVAVAAVLGLGYLQLGGILFLVVGALDTMDGALARVTGKASTFGAFLDSTLDRYSEAVVLLGLLLAYRGKEDLQTTVLIYAVIVGSLMVSYTRARAEGLGLDCEVGLLARPERIVLLGLGLIVDQVTIVLWILAILTNVTAVQRMIHVWGLTKSQAEGSRR
ncbi:MAG: CDP-alcohol phosphatidyltransferase family protein [Chloroflexi bacterium]|nr:CDP-alcohol phosphatidyltransferase family protein [Chloroflexota bacterium]